MPLPRCPRSIRYPRGKFRLAWTVLLFVSGLILLVAVAGCGYGGAGRTTTPTTTTSPSSGRANIVVHSSSAQAGHNVVATATAHCETGETLVSGGFAADIFEADAIIANYPSAANAWTVSGSSPASSITLVAYADCLTNNTGVGIVMAHAQSSATNATVNCPTGATVTGGGYQGVAPRSSYPHGNGWALWSSGAQSATVWALCATRGLTPAPAATTTFTLPTGFGANGGAFATCGAGQIVAGGGFRNDDVYALTDDALTPDGASWGLGANANVSSSSAPLGGTVYAVCVTRSS